MFIKQFSIFLFPPFYAVDIEQVEVVSSKIASYACYYKTCILFVIFEFNSNVTVFTSEEIFNECLKAFIIE